MSKLAEQHCVPCRGGVPPLQGEALIPYKEQLPDWKIVEEHHIAKSFLFPDFKTALDFVNRVGAVAEQEGPPSGFVPGLGQSGCPDLHSQDPGPDWERFHPGCKNRRSVFRGTALTSAGTIIFPAEVLALAAHLRRERDAGAADPAIAAR